MTHKIADLDLSAFGIQVGDEIFFELLVMYYESIQSKVR